MRVALKFIHSASCKFQFITDIREIDRMSSRLSVGRPGSCPDLPQISNVTLNNSLHLCGPTFSHLLSIVKGIPSLAHTGELYENFPEGSAKYFKI